MTVRRETSTDAAVRASSTLPVLPWERRTLDERRLEVEHLRRLAQRLGTAVLR